ncbi:hypothetical protein GH714_032999 [Hevea brasiliensis]|uniref:Uncharacterized protein n=1 Tax=Hevea brasiliensis TaxID=3981 RepID=A0A6A6L2A3_HEVBR|nr:hypothetical protein GH714_032999 [Hevea brasiliensis]
MCLISYFVLYFSDKAINANDDFRLQDGLASLESKGIDGIRENFLWKIEVLQLQVRKLKARIEKVVSENPRKFSSINRLSVPASCVALTCSDQNPASPLENGQRMPARSLYTLSQNMFDFNVGDLIPETAVSSRGEVTCLPVMIESTSQAQADEGILIHNNQVAKEEMQDLKNCGSQLIEKHHLLIEKQTLRASEVDMSPEAFVPRVNFGGKTLPKSRSNVSNNKRKQGRRRSGRVIEPAKWDVYESHGRSLLSSFNVLTIANSMLTGLPSMHATSFVMGTLYKQFLEKNISSFEDFHSGILDIFDTFISELPIEYYDLPSRKELEACFNDWRRAPSHQKEELSVGLMKKSINLSKLVDSILVTGMVTAAMAAKEQETLYPNAIPNDIIPEEAEEEEAPSEEQTLQGKGKIVKYVAREDIPCQPSSKLQQAVVDEMLSLFEKFESELTPSTVEIQVALQNVTDALKTGPSILQDAEQFKKLKRALHLLTCSSEDSLAAGQMAISTNFEQEVDILEAKFRNASFVASKASQLEANKEQAKKDFQEAYRLFRELKANDNQYKDKMGKLKPEMDCLKAAEKENLRKINDCFECGKFHKELASRCEMKWSRAN